MKIIEKYQDPGGNWMVRVLITSIYSQFFIFKYNPLDSEVEMVVYNYLMGLDDASYDAIKSPALKLFENEYYYFIKNEWNTCLKSYGIIPPEYEITIQNTNEAKNIEYLLILKNFSKQEYYNMAGEFDRFKRLINDNGGIMSRVKLHPDV